jgi:uncharacterized membrane protein
MKKRHHVTHHSHAPSHEKLHVTSHEAHSSNNFEISPEFIWWGLLIIAVIIASALIAAIYSINFFLPLQTISGIIFITFIPGYLFVRLFTDHYDITEKIALSFGLSILIVIIAVMTANLIFKVRMTPLANFFAIIFAMCILIVAKLILPFATEKFAKKHRHK